MSSFGSYLPVDEKHRGPLGSVWTAKRPRTGSLVAIKTFEPDRLNLSAAEREKGVEAFLERASEQADFSSRSDVRHWAPIRDFGRFGDGERAYIAMDYYPSSVGKLLSGKVKLSGEELCHLTESTLLALRELAQHRGRAHGKLKPDNILISRQARLASAQIVLADPLPSGGPTHRPAAEAGDLKALGDIILRLAHRATPYQFYDPERPVSRDLGRAGRVCVGFAKRLVEGAPDLSLDEVLGDWQKFRKAARRLAIASKTFFLLAAICLGVASPWIVVWCRGLLVPAEVARPLPQEPLEIVRERWQEYDRNWGERLNFIAFLDALNGPRRTRYHGEDATLRRWLEQYRRLERWWIHELGATRKYLFMPRSFPADEVRRLDAMRLFEGIRNIRAGRWTRLEELKRARSDFERRGWRGAAASLDSVPEQLLEAAGAGIAAGIDAVLDAVLEVRAVEESWKRIESLQRKIDGGLASAGARVPLLARFESNALEGTRAKEDLASLRHATADFEALGQELGTFVSEEWNHLDEAALGEDGFLLRAAAAEPSRREDYTAWLERIRGYRRLDPDPRNRVARWLTAVEAGMTALERLEDDSAAAFRRRVRSARERLDAARQLPAIARNEARLEATAESLRSELERVEGELEARYRAATDDRVAWLTGMRAAGLTLGPPPVNEAYEAWRNRILEGVTEDGIRQLPPPEYRALVNREVALRSALMALVAELPRAADELERLRAYCDERRDEALRQALAGLSEPTEILGLAATSGPLKDHATWLRGLHRLERDFAAMERYVDAYFGLSQRDAAAALPELISRLETHRRELERAAPLREAFAPTARRIDRLREISALEAPDKLLAVTERPEDPAISLAVWRRLGTLAVRWPRDLEELRRELALRRRLSAVFSTRNLPDTELVAESQRRWQIGCSQLIACDDVRAAVGLRRDFFAEDIDAAKLDPAVRARLLLFRLREFVSSPLLREESEVLEYVQSEFLEKMDQLPTLARYPAVGQIRALVESSAAGAASALHSGPASELVAPGLRWEEELPYDGRRVVYRSPGGGRRLEFLRLDGGDARERPVFLCTSEASVGLFIDTLEKAGKFGVIARLMARDFYLREDGRGAGYGSSYKEHRGAITWEWSASGRIQVRHPRDRYRSSRYASDDDGWFNEPAMLRGLDTPPPFYSTEIDSPRGPTDRSPIQNIPLGAAIYFARLLGCRLPTAAEWVAARRTADDRPPGGDNLRDVSFYLQKSHVLETLREARAIPTQAPPYPDTGRFPKPEDPVEAGAPTGLPNDGLLWFREVEREPDGTFHDLVGNVCEFVSKAPMVLPQQDFSEETVRTIVNRGEGEFGVIGASALSPPRSPPEQFQPLNKHLTLLPFSDVGVRLAFTAEHLPLAVQIAELLSQCGWHAAQ